MKKGERGGGNRRLDNSSQLVPDDGQRGEIPKGKSRMLPATGRRGEGRGGKEIIISLVPFRAELGKKKGNAVEHRITESV